MGEAIERGNTHGDGGGLTPSTGGGRDKKVQVPFPRTAEEWDTFVTRYSLGEYYTSDFSEASTSRPSPLPDGPTSGRASPTSRRGSLPLPPGTPPRRSREFSRNQPSPGRDSSGPETSSTENTDVHLDVSACGPSNQDPDIPNIPNASLPSQAPTTSAKARRKPKIPPQTPKDANAMTTENMRQLEETTKGMSLAEDGGKAKEGRVGSGGGRSKDGRRRMQAELATAGPRRDTSSSSENEKVSISSRPRPPRPRPVSRGSRGSIRSRHSREGSVNHSIVGSIDQALLESNTNSSTSVSQIDFEFDHANDRARVRDFYEAHGYMPAPRQAPAAMRRRLRVIRRLGLEHPGDYHRQTLDRFTRLAVNIFKTKMAIVSIVGKDRQTFLSEIGLNMKWTELNVAFCAHTIIGTGEQCLIVPDAQKDWRFNKNPLVDEGRGAVQFYAGAPLVVGSGPKSAIIGSLCVIDDKPRSFSKDDQTLLQDLAECAVSELELIYSQQSFVDNAKLHQISVDFLRRSLKNRPTERAGSSRMKTTNTTSTTSSDGKKRKEGADSHQSEDDVDIYDEACREIRTALDAYAVAVVDLSQFHLFYPAYQSSSTAGTSTRNGSTSQNTRSAQTQSSRGGSSVAGSALDEEPEAYSKSTNVKRARKTWAITDATAPSRTPQVLFIPGRRRSDPKRSKYAKEPENVAGQDDVGPDCLLWYMNVVDFPKQLAVLGYSCAHDGFAFNFTSSPAARKIISDFIASNVKTRRVWYTRDDSEGIAQSITHLMPVGTETSMAMPVFGFDGQVAFAVVACWNDPLYTYPSGAMQFVETIAGSLLASVMKERLHQAERSQLNFAAAASHELRTPLHQINAAATLLRSSLHNHLSSPRNSPSLAPCAPLPSSSPGELTNAFLPPEERVEALAQLEIIEANGLALGNILENIIDTLDIGRLSSRLEQKGEVPGPEALNKSGSGPAPGPVPHDRLKDFSKVLEQVVTDALALESKSRRVQGGRPMDDVEVILEMTPRARGGWMMSDDAGPLLRALGKIIHNSCKFTEKGYIHITVQDVSRDVALPAGYDNSIKISTVSIDIKDSGRGMSADFLEKEVLLPFTKADPFTQGAGLGLGLAQRMIEILGGKLAIASTLGKGTLVHIEMPLHLLNEDNDSDQDELVEDNEGEAGGPQPRLSVRQDGIYLAGFDIKEIGTRRVGKSLLRTLKLNFCRVVTEISYASLIVAPQGVSQISLADLARQARPGVHIIILSKDGETYTAHPSTPAVTPSTVQAEAVDFLHMIPTIYLKRPLRPSLISQIVKPAEVEPPLRETFVSDVVGGKDARIAYSNSQGDATPESSRPSIHRGSSINTVRPSPTQPNFDTEILPSPPTSPRPQTEGSAPPFTTADKDDLIKRSHFLPPLRPVLHQQASDPFPSLPESANLSDSSDSSRHSPPVPQRPLMHEAKSMPVVPDPNPTMDQPLKVLVVEDNAVNRKILTTMLKRTACHYAEAVDGHDAVAKFLSFSPNLVLLDINMPHKDGFAAAAEMREIENNQRRKRATIIAVTAMSGEGQKRRGLLECGIDEWRTKPVSIKDLKADVERLKVGKA